MIRKIYKSGNSYVVSLPKETMRKMGLKEGSSVDVTLLQEENMIAIKPAESSVAGIDETFAQQLDDFIEQYKPALKALAK